MARFHRFLLVLVGTVMLGPGLLLAGCSLTGGSPAAPPSVPAPQGRSAPGAAAGPGLGRFAPGTDVRVTAGGTAWALERDGRGVHVWRLEQGSWHDVTPKSLRSTAVVLYPPSPVAWFADADHAWVAFSVQTADSQGVLDYRKLLARTSDGGSTWTEQALDTGANYDVPVSLFFENARAGFLVTTYNTGGGDSPEVEKLFATVDGGASWKLVAERRGSAGP
ncbi:MAG: hypothetical protein QJR14_08275 [Bacillota bacterium]|nr:hypothetical protein [Bacillota bacterium]